MAQADLRLRPRRSRWWRPENQPGRGRRSGCCLLPLNTGGSLL